MGLTGTLYTFYGGDEWHEQQRAIANWHADADFDRAETDQLYINRLTPIQRWMLEDIMRYEVQVQQQVHAAGQAAVDETFSAVFRQQFTDMTIAWCNGELTIEQQQLLRRMARVMDVTRRTAERQRRAELE